MIKLGSHVGCSGPNMLLDSVNEALGYGANCLMLYTGAPQNTIRKPLSQMKIKEAKELLEKNNMSALDIVVHAPYIVNLANPDLEKRNFAIAFTIDNHHMVEIGLRLLPGENKKQSISIHRPDTAKPYSNKNHYWFYVYSENQFNQETIQTELESLMNQYTE